MNNRPYIWVFPKIGVPQNGWLVMENPMKMDDLEESLFLETPTYWFIRTLYILTYQNWYRQAIYFDLKVHPRSKKKMQIDPSKIAGCLDETDCLPSPNRSWSAGISHRSKNLELPKVVGTYKNINHHLGWWFTMVESVKTPPTEQKKNKCLINMYHVTKNKTQINPWTPKISLVRI